MDEETPTWTDVLFKALDTVEAQRARIKELEARLEEVANERV